MALIGKIQEKGKYVLIGLVGLSLLLFIFSSFFDVIGSSQADLNLGTIDGVEVDQKAYEENVQQFASNDSLQAAQQQQPYGEKEQEQSRDKAWQATVDKIIIDRECEALGIDVSDDELNSFFYGEKGFTLMQDVATNPQFMGPNGQFSKDKFAAFLKERDKEKDPAKKAQWEMTKKSFKQQRKREKYMQYLASAAYVTKLEAKNEYYSQKTSKNISFVMYAFRDILDTDIKITEKQISAFYEKNKEKKKYEVLAGRDVMYFDIAIEPSKKDIKTFNDKMNKRKAEWLAADNDSTYAVTNGGFYTKDHRATFKPEGDAKAQQGMTYPAALDTVFKTATIGQLVGPYEDQGRMRLAKVVDFNTKLCSVRHILIEAKKGDAAAEAAGKKLSDSLMKIVTKDNFENLVRQYSKDPGSIEKGGKYEDFLDYEMVPEFSKFASEEPVGKMGVVKTDFGYHIMEVLGRKEVKYPILSIIDDQLLPSMETENNILSKANSLLAKIDAKVGSKEDVLAKIAVFDTIARKEGYYARPLRLVEESPKVSGFNTTSAANKIIELAFTPDNEVGTVYGSPIRDGNRVVIAMLSSKREKGVPALHDNYVTFRTDAIKELKAKRLLKKMGNVTNLEALAKKGKTQVMKADITFGNPSIQGGGYEMKIVGSLFSGKVKDGQTIKAVVGESGVYVIRVNKTTKAPAAKNYDAEQASLLQAAKQAIQSTSSYALQRKLNVMDNRALSNIGIERE